MHIREIIGNAGTTKRWPQERQFTFIGWYGGWYVLLLRAGDFPVPEVQAFRKPVMEWLVEREITPNTWSDLTDGDRGLWLFFRRAPDVLRFQREFGVRGITPHTMYAAMRAEALSASSRT